MNLPKLQKKQNLSVTDFSLFGKNVVVTASVVLPNSVSFAHYTSREGSTNVTPTALKGDIVLNIGESSLCFPSPPCANI